MIRKLKKGIKKLLSALTTKKTAATDKNKTKKKHERRQEPSTNKKTSTHHKDSRKERAEPKKERAHERGEHRGDRQREAKKPRPEHKERAEKHEHKAPEHKEHRRREKKDIVMPELHEIPAEEGKTRFIDLSIAKEVLCATQDLGFKYCTPIQEKSLPCLLEGRDLAGKAQTGTGKTAAFLIAIFNGMLKNPKPDARRGTCRALIMAPTRELAIQIHKDAEALAKYCGFNNNVVFGGMGHREQRSAVAEGSTDVLVGTPGRIIDYSRSNHLDLSECEFLVIDEADRMLDMGFIPDVKRIIGQLPPTGQRQTMLFSATLDRDILNLAARWLHEPVTVEVEPEHKVTDLITQRFYAVSETEKIPFLLWMCQNTEISRMLIFGNRKDRIEVLSENLIRNGVECEVLSGDVPQQKRIKILERFRSGETKVLVASDVAARGIHVDNVSHVVNYDLPEKSEDYIHRVGRTGRAGVKGEAVSFICEYGAFALDGIERELGSPIKSERPEEHMLSIVPDLIAPRRRRPFDPDRGRGRPRRDSRGGGGRGRSRR